MASRDKIYGTQKQYNELNKWLLENEKPIDGYLPSDRMYSRNGYDKNHRPIANFYDEINDWLLENCPIQWVLEAIKN